MDENETEQLRKIIRDATRMAGRWARGAGIDHDDIAQTVAIYQWQRADLDKVNFATVRSRSIDALRSLKRRRESERDAAAHGEQVTISKKESNDHEEVASQSENVLAIIGELFSQAQLSLNTETILYQHFAESFSIRKISLMWQIDEHEVQRVIVNGLDKLRKILWKLR